MPDGGACRPHQQQQGFRGAIVAACDLLDGNPDDQRDGRQRNGVFHAGDELNVADVAGDERRDDRLERDRVEEQHRHEFRVDGTAATATEPAAGRGTAAAGQRQAADDLDELHPQQRHDAEQRQVGHDDDDRLHPRPRFALAVDVVLILRGLCRRREHVLNLTRRLLCLADELHRPSQARDVILVVELAERTLEVRPVVDLGVHRLELLREFARRRIGDGSD